MSKRSELVAGFVLVVLGLLLAVGLVELSVRALHLVPDRFWEPDPKTGVRLKPGMRGWWTQEEREFVIPVQINPQGLRDLPRPYAKPPGVLRILVIGDSFVEAMHVRLEDVFTRRLERLLEGVGANYRVEVIAAGVSGWGTASELLWLQEEGKKYQPDVVLLSFYPGNDIKNNSPTLEDGLPPVYDQEGNLLYVSSNKPPTSSGHALLGRSKTYVFLRQLLLTRRPAFLSTLERLGLVRVPPPRMPAMREGLPVDFGVYEVPPAEDWLDAWQRTARLLEVMEETAKFMGARFGIVIAAGREQVYPASWDRILATYAGMEHKHFDLEQPERWVMEWCSTRRVPCLRLTPSFRAAAEKSKERLHFWYDGHWTREGHRIAAEEVRKFLLANFPLS